MVSGRCLRECVSFPFCELICASLSVCSQGLEPHAGEPISLPRELAGNPNGCTAGRGRKGERWSLRHRKAPSGQFPAAVLTDDRLKIMGIHHLRVLAASCPALVPPDSTLTPGRPTLLESVWEMLSPSVFQLLGQS